MTDFDYQWKFLMTPEAQNNKDVFEFNGKRIKEFLNLTKIKPWFKKTSFIKDKNCLDAGCGPGRWTYAMQKLGAAKVDSFDISSEAIKKCQEINSNAYVFDIWDLKPNPIYDFVLSWGVLHHTENTRKAFSKVASQVKKGGMLHVMIYDKKNDWFYDGFRGETCLEKHKFWEALTEKEKIDLCKKMANEKGGNIHGWFDALNPTYNWSHTKTEVKEWFQEEGFTQIKSGDMTYNINMNGILS